MGPPPGNISYVSIQHAQHTHPRLKSRYRDIQHHLDRVDQNQSVFRLPIEICETSSGRFLWSLLDIINMLNPISYSFTIHRKISAESNENKLTAVHPLSEPFFYHPHPCKLLQISQTNLSTRTVFHTGGRDARSVFKSPKRKLPTKRIDKGTSAHSQKNVIRWRGNNRKREKATKFLIRGKWQDKERSARICGDYTQTARILQETE